MKIHVIDSHTGGEPTRLVLTGIPALGAGTAAEKLEQLKAQDQFRRSVMNEPRGNEVLVGAILTETSCPGCDYGLLFFNNVGYLGMCGHGTIGVVATLAWQGKISPGVTTFETPVGLVTATLHDDGSVSVANVSSWRTAKDLAVTVPGIGQVIGDLAWGGNWFYLVKQSPLPLTVSNAEALTEHAWKIRQALNQAGYPEVDHIELFGPPLGSGHSRNFVLCPGKAYDRSPCGTGTSAKLACLAADGVLAPQETWVQESVVGSTFVATFQWADECQSKILPTIRGTAHVMAEAMLILDPADPFRYGLAEAECLQGSTSVGE